VVEAGLAVRVREIARDKQSDFLTSTEIRKGKDHIQIMVRKDVDYDAPDLDASLSFELNRPNCQRIFACFHAQTNEVLATCALFPAQISGVIHPRLLLAQRKTGAPVPVPVPLDRVGWVELKVLDPGNRGKGIAAGFARKLLSSERLDFRRDFQHFMTLIDEENVAGVALAASLGSKVILRNRHQLFFFFAT
jgi:hypothetical protein